MTFKLTMIAAALLAAVAGVGLAQAAGSADDAIQARQAEMKANNKAMGDLVAILKGQTPYDPATVKAAADSITAATATAEAAKAWDASFQTGSVKSRAKPEVWSDAAGFAAAKDKLSSAVVALAATTDQGSFKQAFMQLGGACKGCHETYRLPED